MLHQIAKPILVAAALCLGGVQAAAQTEVTRYIPGSTPEGVTYYLPQTALKITVIASRVTVKPGDFKDYAQRYLRLGNVTQAEKTTWKIDKVYITPYGVPDTSKAYSIPLRKKTIAPLVGLTKDGIITSINIEGVEDEMPKVPEINTLEQSALKPRDYMTEEILYAGSQSKMAELTANEIYDIRESRSALSKGEADNMPKDGEQLKLMINQLNTQEEALLQLFKGTQESETKTYTLHFLPKGEATKQILFRFSEELGLVDKTNLAGAPVYIDIKDKKTVPEEVVNPKLKKAELEAVRYNVPSQVDVKIYDRERTLVNVITPMGQFGKTEILSSELFNKRISTQVTFYSTTGALKRVVDATGGE